jgi:signal peptidase II
VPPSVWLFATAAATYALDRVTKIWAEDRLAGRPPVVVVRGVLDLSYTTNSGGAFGLGQSAWWIFASATIGVSAAILIGAPRVRRTSTAVALGLVLGGALGNLTDRLLHGDMLLRGYVIDFIDFHVWPVFNVADAAIVVGAVLLAVTTARQREG